ncbi:MAG TPA: DUF6364 family protein [Chitinophagaceae bacterium]|nr:DUF6364 family protein [Chitinophagaceae bacterium]
MNTKLTLTLEKQVIDSAKRYAKDTDRSLSNIIENYLRQVTETNYHREEISSKLNSIIGSVKIPDDFDEKKALREYLQEKHL